MGMHPSTFKKNYEFDNGDPAIDPRLKKEESLTNKQLKLIGQYEEKKVEDDKFKLSADGLFVEEGNKAKETKTDEKQDLDDEVKIAEQALKEDLEKSKSKASDDKKADPASGDATKEPEVTVKGETKEKEDSKADEKPEAPVADAKKEED